MMVALGQICPRSSVVLLTQTGRAALTKLALAWAAIFILFLPDWADMVGKWSDDTTFNHCFLLVPILGWLVWIRRRELAQLTPVGWKPGLIWVAGATLCWFLGALADVALFRHAGIVGMLQGAVLTVMGPQVARGLLFPLFYMIFLVPFGTELVPPLQKITASIIMPLLSLAGVAATVDGIFITAPSGYFRVAEACAGLNFLMAMLALGALIANLCFKSWRARAIFMLVCIIVPVLTNGLRAWGTIMLAEHMGIEYAQGSTHILYGWVVFAIGMALTIGIAWRWFDRAPEDPAFDPATLREPKFEPASHSLLAAMLAIPALALGWSLLSEQAGARDLPNAVELPDVPGWTRTKTPQPFWEPNFDGADHLLLGAYRNVQGDIVDLTIVLYGTQEQGREIAGFGQGAANEELHWNWVGQEKGPASGYRGERLVGPNKTARIAWTSLIMGDKAMASGAEVKLVTLKSRLVMGDRRAAALVISTVDYPDRDEARILSEFSTALGDPAKLTGVLLDQAEGQR